MQYFYEYENYDGDEKEKFKINGKEVNKEEFLNYFNEDNQTNDEEYTLFEVIEF